MTPAAKRKAAGDLREARPASERRTCRLLGLHRSTARSRPEPGRDDGPLADRLRELARRHPRYGYLTPPRMLKREGLAATRKRTHRVYARLGLQVRTKRRRRLWRPRVPLAAPTRPNERWSIDFMSDQLASGRRLRIPDVDDDFSRPRVGQLVATSITGARLALFLDELGKAAATPKAVVCDNGPEPASKAMRFWSERSGAALNFIQPGGGECHGRERVGYAAKCSLAEPIQHHAQYEHQHLNNHPAPSAHHRNLPMAIQCGKRAEADPQQRIHRR